MFKCQNCGRDQLTRPHSHEITIRAVSGGVKFVVEKPVMMGGRSFHSESCAETYRLTHPPMLMDPRYTDYGLPLTASYESGRFFLFTKN